MFQTNLGKRVDRHQPNGLSIEGLWIGEEFRTLWSDGRDVLEAHAELAVTTVGSVLKLRPD
jgi:hypothetical protein